MAFSDEICYNVIDYAQSAHTKAEVRMIETLTGVPVSKQKAIFGEMDEFAKQIEKTLRVTIVTREQEIRVVGEEGPCSKAKRVLTTLLELAARGSEINITNVNYTLSLVKENEEQSMLSVDLPSCPIYCLMVPPNCFLRLLLLVFMFTFSHYIPYHSFLHQKGKS